MMAALIGESKYIMEILPGARAASLATFDMTKLEIVDAAGNRTEMAQLDNHHFGQLEQAAVQGSAVHPILGRPVYFTNFRTGGIGLYPRANAVYRLEATYRAPVKRGRPPEPGEALDPATGDVVKA